MEIIVTNKMAHLRLSELMLYEKIHRKKQTKKGVLLGYPDFVSDAYTLSSS